MPIFDDLEFSQYVRNLPAASETDLSAYNNMPIVRSGDVKKLPAGAVAKSKELANAANAIFGYAANVPNVDSENKTIDFGGSFLIRTKNNYVVITERSVPICDTSITSSSQLLTYSFSTNSFSMKAYANKSLDENTVVVGYIRFGDNVNFKFIRANFPFPFTLNGKSTDAAVTRNEINIEKNQAEIEKLYVTSADAQEKKDGFFQISTGYFVADTKLETFVFKNHGYEKVEFVSGFQQDTMFAVTFFNSEDTSVYNSIDFAHSLPAEISTNKLFAVDIPEKCKLIAVSRRIDKSSDFYIRITKLDSYKAGFETNTATSYEDVGFTLASSVANRIITRYEPTTSQFKFSASIASGYNFALHLYDENGSQTFDSGWKTSFYYSSKNSSSFNLWVKKTDNTNFTEEEKSTVNAMFTSLNVIRLERRGEPASINYVDNKVDKAVEMLTRKKIIINIAHQGFSTNGQSYGNSRISSYIGAAKNGFDYGECDIKWSSDGVPVCCHDETFVDGFSGNTITIAEHTLAELKTYQYYGETIATFDEVVATCKNVGIGLWVDHTGTFMGDESKRALMFSIVKKYAMEDNVGWYVGTTNASLILDWYARASIGINYARVVTDEEIETINGLADNFNRIYLNFSAADVSVENVKLTNSKLKCGVKIGVWTIDNMETYEQYKPYVAAITSNKLSEQIING